MDRDQSKVPLDYDRNPVPYVTRRSYRVLLFLTLLNTILLCSYILGPQTFQIVKQQWNSYQYRRAQRFAEQQRNAQRFTAQSGCLTYTFHPNFVVYDEDPTSAAKKILDSAHYHPAEYKANNASPPPGWQVPVAADDPDCHQKLKKIDPGDYGYNVVFFTRAKNTLRRAASGRRSSLRHPGLR